MSKAQLTVRGFDRELEHHLQRLSEELNISLNKAAVLLMRKGAGLETSGNRPDVVGNSLDHLMGLWSPEEAAEFQEATKEFDRIDESLRPGNGDRSRSAVF